LFDLPVETPLELTNCYNLKYSKEILFLAFRASIKTAGKYLNDVILSSAKNLAFSCYYEILHGACPERNDKILRCAQNDKAKGLG
jgi:hypothetical protein